MFLGQPDFSIIGRNECVCQKMAECIIRVTILFDGKSDRTESKIHKRGKCFIDLKCNCNSSMLLGCDTW